MNTHEKNKLKDWLQNCPNKKIVGIINIFLVLSSLYFIYRLGYAVGVFLSNIGF